MRNLPDIWREFDRPFTSAWSDLDRPFGSIQPMLRQLDDFFRDFSSRRAESESMVPSCEVKEKKDHYLLSFDMPGLVKDNINVEVQGNQLIVSGERKQEKQETEGRIHFSERSIRSFERRLTLPTDAKNEEMEAEYQNGVLSLTIPKSPELRPHKISIGEKKSGILAKHVEDASKKDKLNISVKNSEVAASTH